MEKGKLLLKGLLLCVLLATSTPPSATLSGSDGPKEPAAYYLTGNDAAAPGSEVIRVKQKDKAFHPNLTSVSVGGSVAFPNRDVHMHNVYSQEGVLGFFDLGSSEKTKSDESNLLSKEMPKAGVVKISCAIHPVMKGTIFVVPSKFHTVSRDGTYEFSGMPSGEYDLMVMDQSGSTSKLKTVQID